LNSQWKSAAKRRKRKSQATVTVAAMPQATVADHVNQGQKTGLALMNQVTGQQKKRKAAIVTVAAAGIEAVTVAGIGAPVVTQLKPSRRNQNNPVKSHLQTHQPVNAQKAAAVAVVATVAAVVVKTAVAEEAVATTRLVAEIRRAVENKT
jgi:hypothetical protein